MSRGKFRGSIAMSASLLCPWAFQPPELARRRAFELARQLNHSCTTNEELLRFFYNASVRELVYATETLTKFDPPFKPTVENSSVTRPEEAFLTRCPYELMKNGDFSKTPQLTGYTYDEIIFFAGSVGQILEYVKNITSQLNENASKLPIPLPSLSYLVNVSTYIVNNIADNTSSALLHSLSDLLFVSGLEEKQTLLSKEIPVYYYRMSFDSPFALHKSIYHININETAHEDDVGYLFDNIYTHMPTNPNSDLSVFRMRLARLWANFVKYLDPTPFGKKDEFLNLEWPVSGEEGLQVNLDNNLTVHKRLASEEALVDQKVLELIMPLYTGCSSLWATLLNDKISSTGK